ncbi:MAG: DUF4230 domain-containing protein [Clostridium sartagoforme]|nr:DUF4230 domain-containing protein [Clostridium sartagoforme]
MSISKTFRKIRKIIKLSCFILILLGSIILFIRLYFFNSSSNDTILNINTEESIIKEMKNTSKIIPLEVELSKIITIDKSWGDLEVFKKYKRIKFFANCSFYIDLSNLKEDDIIIDKNLKSLSATIPSPKIFSIDIIRDKTIYEDSSNGLLRFGEITLTSEEFELIQEDIHKSFESTLNEKEIYDKAISSSKISLTKLFSQIIGDDMSINIYFK